ncbi:MAG TPA: hypothetical protein VKW06_06250 [Candidatus Angelobacter sp.]|nr:hypothetical protein [Candidatus Angelobacter sp.]
MPAKKSRNKKKASGRKSTARKKPSVKNKKRTAPGKKATSKGRSGASKRRTRRSSSTAGRISTQVSSGELSGDLQGLSRTARADSESVDELLEEGNAFEAGVIEGVEDAGARSEREVHTREVPEDDVPGEYLDQD